MDANAESLAVLKEQYQCPSFRILVVGRANAGKTTIIEKVCGMAQGTKPIIFDEHGVELQELAPDIKKSKSKFKLPGQLLAQLLRSAPAPSTHLTPSMVSCMPMDLHPLISNQFQMGIRNIEHQITYPGSNYIFHNSMGFEAGATEEMEIVWNFIEKRSTTTETRDQLHAIWYFCWLFTLLDDHVLYRYCIPMDGIRPILSAELEFFNKGTGKGKFLNHQFFLPCAQVHH